MSKRGISLGQTAIAAIAAVSLSLPLMSIAQAQDATKPAARMAQKYHRHAQDRALHNSMRDPADPADWGGVYMMQADPYGIQDDAYSAEPGENPLTPKAERPFQFGDYYGSNGM